MKYHFLILAFVFSLGKVTSQHVGTMNQIIATKTTDFELNGQGTSKSWETTPWVDVPQRAHTDVQMPTKVKVLYSETGIYFLFHCQDPKLNASILEDGKHLWLEDVVEVFLWPDTTKEVYFEYELSPLNHELPLMVINVNGKPHRWQAWYLEDNRNIVHKTSVQGGKKESNAPIESWRGEFFIPYSLLSPMVQDKPTFGTKWKINFNRMDYLDGKVFHWSWQDLPGSFHDIKRFGTLIFK